MMDQVSMMDKLLPDTSSCARSTVRPNRNDGIWSRESFIAGTQGKWGLTHTKKDPKLPKEFQQSIFKGHIREVLARYVISLCRIL